MGKVLGTFLQDSVMRKLSLTLPDLGQWLGLLALIAGIALMIADNRAPGATLIAISSLFYAVVTKIKYYGRKGKRHESRIKVSYQKLKGRMRFWRCHKRDQLAYDDRYGSGFSGMLETGAGARADRGKSKSRLRTRRSAR